MKNKSPKSFNQKILEVFIVFIVVLIGLFLLKEKKTTSSSNYEDNQFLLKYRAIKEKYKDFDKLVDLIDKEGVVVKVNDDTQISQGFVASEKNNNKPVIVIHYTYSSQNKEFNLKDYNSNKYDSFNKSFSTETIYDKEGFQLIDFKRDIKHRFK